MRTDLDTFETQLLDELRAAVATRAHLQSPAPSRPAHRLPRRITAASLTAAAAVAVIAVLLPGVHGSPAYAVQDGSGGTIDVRVNRLEDAAGLEQALAEHGVNADVQFLGDNLQCAPDRYRPAPSIPDSDTGFTVGDGIAIQLDRQDLTHGDTVVIAASRTQDGVYAEVGIARGLVKNCQPVAMTQRP